MSIPFQSYLQWTPWLLHHTIFRFLLVLQHDVPRWKLQLRQETSVSEWVQQQKKGMPSIKPLSDLDINHLGTITICKNKGQ